MPLLGIYNLAFGTRDANIAHLNSQGSRLNVLIGDSYFDIFIKTVSLSGKSINTGYNQ